MYNKKQDRKHTHIYISFSSDMSVSRTRNALADGSSFFPPLLLCPDTRSLEDSQFTVNIS